MNHCRTVIIVIILLTGLFLTARQTEPCRTVRYDDSNGLSGTLVGGGLQDRNGLMWFATWNGLDCYDGYEFHRMKIRPGDSAAIGTNRIRDILLSEQGNIVCRTDEDIYEFDLSRYTFRDIPEERKDSLKGKMGRTWRGLTDRQGNIWRADPSGLYKTCFPHHPARLLDGTSGAHPRSLMVDRDSMLWVGLRNNHSINVYDRSSTLVRTIPLETAPYCIYRTSHGDIWIGGKPGALIRNGGESISPDAVYDMAEDRYGRLWIATFGAGVKCCENPQAMEPELSESLGGYKVRKIIITPSDNIIAATTEGLLVGTVDSADCRNTRLMPVRRDGNRPGSLCSNAVMSVARDTRGNIIIGTESSGIDIISEERLFDDKPEFRHLNTGNSTLASDVCRAMALVSDTLLLIVGRNHVMALNPSTEQTVNFGRTFWNDTCRFAETEPVMLPDGTWVVGAEEGAFCATPHNIYSRGYVPPLVFTTLAVNGRAPAFCLASRDTLFLEPDQRNISIAFAAIDYTDNSGILYRSRLDGSPWTGAGTVRNVTLFNLSPGTHRLEVQSTDRYGRWVDNNRLLSVVVAPYWYETWWATALFVLVAAVLAGLTVYIIMYIRDVNRQRRDLLEKYMAVIGEMEARSMQDSDCLTASPEDMAPLVPEQKPEDTAFLNRVRRYIEENIDNPDAGVDSMADAAAVSRSTLNRHLRAQLGISATQLLIEARMQRAEQLLRARSAGEPLSLSDIAAMCGYSDVQYFQRVFKKRHSVAPADYNG